ncbi:MAG TPA: TIM44-like domain-containing protein [Candidatus Eremiobacteraceae bacterium]|nr:TIM44-like domain-containing protein [Candidatus Eremiobacteraceae bacterium]
MIAIYKFVTERSSDGQHTWFFKDPAKLDPDFSPTAQAWTVAPPPSIQDRVHDEVTGLQQIDPDFNDLQFLAQAAASYQTYLACDADMNADGMTAIATPQCVAAYRAHVANWKSAGLRRVVRDTKMVSSAIINVMLDGLRQAIVVRVVSTGVRFTQDIKTGAAAVGNPQSDYFTEFVTFVRPPGTTTPKSAGAGGATHCPSCGAPTAAGAATCPFCGTQLTGTGGIWLLDHVSASAYT